MRYGMERVNTYLTHRANLSLCLTDSGKFPSGSLKMNYFITGLKIFFHTPWDTWYEAEIIHILGIWIQPTAMQCTCTALITKLQNF
jgi:hypothetical protein